MVIRTLEQAKDECERWFSHLQAQEDKSLALQKLAADRRSGQCDEIDGKRRRDAINGNGITVYDGANLADAVRILLKHVK